MYSDDWWVNMDAYYVWARAQSPDRISYPGSIPTRRMLGGMIGEERLSDDEALAIDAALCDLKEDDAPLFKLVEQVHGDGRSLRWMEENGYGDRRRLGRLLGEAHRHVRSFVRGRAAA